jgi:hypothetical protein
MKRLRLFSKSKFKHQPNDPGGPPTGTNSKNQFR